MKPNLQPSIVSLTELFRARMFLISPTPEAPSWGPGQVSDLCQDLTTASGEEPHFLGTLIAWPEGAPAAGSAGLRFARWTLLDGRQRMMSIISWMEAAIEGIAGLSDTDGPMLASILRRRYLDVDGAVRFEMEHPSHLAFYAAAIDHHRTQLAGHEAIPEQRFAHLLGKIEQIEQGTRFLLYPAPDRARAEALLHSIATRGRP